MHTDKASRKTAPTEILRSERGMWVQNPSLRICSVTHFEVTKNGGEQWPPSYEIMEVHDVCMRLWRAHKCSKMMETWCSYITHSCSCASRKLLTLYKMSISKVEWMRISVGKKEANVMHPRLLFRYFVTTSDHLRITQEQSDQHFRCHPLCVRIEFVRSNRISLLTSIFAVNSKKLDS